MTPGDALATFVAFADILAGVFGVIAAIVLGWPVWKSLRNRQRWTRARTLEAGSDDPRTRKALGGVRKDVEAEQYQAGPCERILYRIGFALLFAAFFCLTVSAVDRAVHRSSPPAAASGS